MTDEEKHELFPFFAFLFTKQTKPNIYGNVNSFEEWTKILEQNPKDIEEVTKAATKLTDEDWLEIETKYTEYMQQGETEEPATDVFSEEQQVEMAKKGAKLQKLQEYKKGKKMSKKCSCGCDLVFTKEKGGKITSKCACGCKAKKEEGGKINEAVKSLNSKKIPSFKQKK